MTIVPICTCASALRINTLRFGMCSRCCECGGQSTARAQRLRNARLP
jgi:hypothetical protein